MKVSEIFSKEIVYYGGIKNPDFRVSWGFPCSNLDTLPDVEFGRTYFIRAYKDGLWSLYGVKFYGIVNPYCNGELCDQKIMLIGSLSTGETVYFSGDKQICYDTHIELSKRLFASVNDFNDDAEVVSITINYAKARLINYLYPDKFKFYKNTEGIEVTYMFRFIWNGEKVLCHNEISLYEYFVIFFAKPLFDVSFATSGYSYHCIKKEHAELGVLLTPEGSSIRKLDDDINNFINNTYGTSEECRSKNEMKVYRFEGEEVEVEEEENEDELIYIEFVGLVTREKAKRIFAELCDKNIEK